MTDIISDEERPTTTSADLLELLRREQAAFRRVMTALIALLVVAAAIAAGGAALTYLEVQDIRQQYRTQKLENTANLKVVAGEAGRQRESMRSELIQIREEAESARRRADLTREIERAAEADAIGNYRDQAYTLAKAHILGRTLDASTASVVARVLGASVGGEPLITGDERRILDVAKLDWEKRRADAEAGFRALLSDGESREGRALGAAGLSLVYYRDASETEASFGWDRGCREVVEYAIRAEDAGLNAPGLLLRKAECLRKHGEALRAYNAFSAAADALDATGTGAYPEEARLAAHGVGTTLVSLIARDEIPSSLSRREAIDRARALLTQAADLRAKRGATPVGIAYSTENLGFLYVLEEDWAGALAHTAEIDAVLPLAWNLTIRYIAATERRAGLEAEEADADALQALEAIAAQSRLTMSLMKYAQVDEPELKRLLPEAYEPVVDELVGALNARAAGGAP